MKEPKKSMGPSLYLYEYKRKGYISFIQQKIFMTFSSSFFSNGVAFLYSNKNFFGVWIKKGKAKRAFHGKKRKVFGLVWVESKTFMSFDDFLKWLLLLKFSFHGYLLILFNDFVIRNSNNAIRYFNEFEIGANIAWWLSSFSKTI